MTQLIPLYVLYIINFFRYVRLYPHAIVSPKSFLQNVKLGKKSFIQGGIMLNNCTVGDYSYLSGTEAGGVCSHIWNTTIGKYCSIAHNLEVRTDTHQLNYITTFPFQKSTNSFLYNKQKHSSELEGKTVIGNDVWIGMNVSIVGARIIGDGAVVGAGAVVVADIPDYAVVVGCPAKVVKYRFSQKQIEKLKKIQWWNWTEEQIRARRGDLMSSKINDFVTRYETK